MISGAQIFQCAFLVIFFPLLLVTAMGMIYRLSPSPNADFFQNILLGHRGCRIPEIPENSIESIRYSYEKGSDGSEFDIQLTRDLQVVVFHDTNVKRILNVKKGAQERTFTGSERVDDLTLDELQTHFRFKTGKNDVVPTFENLLDEMDKLDSTQKMMIEIKGWEHLDVLSDAVVVAFMKYKLHKRAVVGSFNPIVLYHVRRKDPGIVTLLLVKKLLLTGWLGPDINSTPKSLFHATKMQKYLFGELSVALDYLLYHSCITWLPSFLGAGVIGIDNNLVRSGDFKVSSWRNSGYIVNIWVVNEQVEKSKYEDLSVAITTDVLFRK